ncbi:hypothetical protein CEE69_24135 [Rhodopirellula bahusiensis]|uniref:DUF4349 domain-containing protein n=2 Tax=Rhodopirellula bahusiensis TaxID=2014065 RepID=A0A2G1W150_9BACT|nr:hypothetical protein CEE69_24135 [Rhodopirellula bahusiensis]
MNMEHFRNGLLLILLSIAGCGQQSSQFSTKLDLVSEQAVQERTAAAFSVAQTPNRSSEIDEADSGALEDDQTSKVAKSNRRIVYNTHLSLVVKEYAIFESELPDLVDQHGGFISNSETNRRYNNRQSGLWVARIPVANYVDFLQGVTGLGFAESRTEDAQDVTAEFVDVEARIRNNKKLEERIITMLEERTGKLSDVLEIERELSRVREEVERMEGRLRVLADRSSLATITIKCREEKEYVPPASPTFSSRIQMSWSESINAMKQTGENIAIAAIAVLPWLFVFAVPILVSVAVGRRILRKRSK